MAPSTLLKRQKNVFYSHFSSKFTGQFITDQLNEGWVQWTNALWINWLFASRLAGLSNESQAGYCCQDPPLGCVQPGPNHHYGNRTQRAVWTDWPAAENFEEKLALLSLLLNSPKHRRLVQLALRTFASEPLSAFIRWWETELNILRVNCAGLYKYISLPSLAKRKLPSRRSPPSLSHTDWLWADLSWKLPAAK